MTKYSIFSQFKALESQKHAFGCIITKIKQLSM